MISCFHAVQETSKALAYLLCLALGLLSSPLLAEEVAVREAQSYFLEDLTWVEVRDSIAKGKTTIVVPTGGIEQSGPYLALGKHNFILSKTMGYLAAELKDTLIAPILPYVPEGSISPPDGHMKYPGTISIGKDIFIELLKDIARSLKVSGFKTIVFLGDSGDNQDELKIASEQLSTEWSGSEVQALYVPEYYDYTEAQIWISSLGYIQIPEGIHDDLSFSSELLAVDPSLVRYRERLAQGKARINGVSLIPFEEFFNLGHTLLQARARVAAEAIRIKRRRNPSDLSTETQQIPSHELGEERYKS